MKKFPSLKSDLFELVKVLKENPRYGTELGSNCFKVRIAIASKRKGKSGGARVITHFYVSEDTIILLSIYDKSEQPDISEKQIFSLLQQINL